MFTFNGIDFSKHIRGIVDIQRPLMAPQKIATTSIEGKAEEMFHRKTSATYNVDITFIISANSRIELLSKFRKIAGMLDTEAPAKLIFHDEPDKYVKVIYEDSDIEYRANKRHADVTISFKVLDPYWYAITDDTETYFSSGVKPVVRQGNAESYPLIKIRSDVAVTGKMSIGANGSLMTYEGSLGANEWLVFDSALLTAYILATDGATKKSILNRLDVLDFPILAKGDNDFTVTMPASVIGKFRCEIYCNSRWK